MNHHPSPTSLWGRTYVCGGLWAERLAKARDAGAVVQVARDYLAEWTPQELGILPESCQAPALRDANDVAAYAFALMQEECKVYERGCELLGMSAFFAAASTRLSIILAHAKGDPIRLFVTQ